MSLGPWGAGGASALAGALSVLAHAPFGVWPILIFSLTALVWLLDGAAASKRPMRAAFWRGWAFAFGYFFFGLYWVAYAFLNRGPDFAPLIPFAITLLPAGLALFWGAACAIALRFWRGDLTRVLVLGLSLFAAEFARGHLFGGFPWNLPGLVWPAGGPVSQSVSIIGVYGLTLLTLIGFAAPATLADDGPSPAWRAALPASAFAVFAALFAGGLGRLAPLDTPRADAPSVRIVQSGLTQQQKWAPENRAMVVDRFIEGSAPQGAPAADLVVWPETALPVPLLEDGAVLSRLAERLGDDTWLAAGIFRRSNAPDGGVDFHNALAVLGFQAGEARLAGLYDKTRLVPFGEFTPGGGLLTAMGFRLPSAIADGLEPGPGPVVLDTPAAPPFAPMICYEIIFPSFAPEGGERPDWILNVSNDAWFGPTPGPRQHLVQAQYRAIEEGLPVIRAASGGVSAAIDSRGRIRAAMFAGEANSVTVPLPPSGDVTFFSTREKIVYISIVGIVLGLIALLRRLVLTREKSQAYLAGTKDHKAVIWKGAHSRE